MWWYLLVIPAVVLVGAVVAVVFVAAVAFALASMIALPILTMANLAMIRLPRWVRGR